MYVCMDVLASIADRPAETASVLESLLSICKAASTVRGADAQTERFFPCRNLSLRYGSQTPRCESRLGSQEPILLQRRSSGSTSRACFFMLRLPAEEICAHAMVTSIAPLGVGRDGSLSFIAGLVNAAGYPGFRHESISNMTGNTSLLGIALGDADAREAVHWALAMCRSC